MNTTNQKPKLTATRQPPKLQVSPTAWAKLLFLRDAGDTEIAGFGIAAADDALYVEDVQLVEQVATWMHVEMNDESVADYFDAQVDAGRRPEQFARIWIHTHPGNSPLPSGTDEATFVRVFGRADWAVMFILARGGQTFARLLFNVGPGGEIEVPVDIDYCRPFSGSDETRWQYEYEANVHLLPDSYQPVAARARVIPSLRHDDFVDDGRYGAWDEYQDFDFLQPERPYGYIRDF